MIVVLDTNVWISGLQFARNYGLPTRALQQAMERDILATSAAMNKEIYRVLTHKFGWEPDRAEAAIKVVLRRSIVVEVTGTVKVCRDPGDDMFLECTTKAGAEMLVTGDQDLLTLESYAGTRIVTPATYLAWHKP